MENNVNNNNVSSTENINENSQGNIVLTKNVKPMSKGQFFLLGCYNTLKKIVLWVVDLLWSIVLSLGHFGLMIGRGCYHITIGAFNFIKNKCHQFKYNDWSGRLSFIVFGASSFKHKQIGNGILFILFEIGYILFLVLGGAHNIYMLGTLGTFEGGTDPNCDDIFCDYLLPDNSIMILIYGLLSLISVFVFLYIWNRSINSGYNNYRIDHYMLFKGIYSENEELSETLDKNAKEAVYNEVSFGNYKKENGKKYLEYTVNFDGIEDKKVRKTHVDLCKLISSESMSHSYKHYKKFKIMEEKLVELEEKLAKIEASRTEKRAKFDVNDEESLELFDSKTLSLVSNQKLKIKKQKNKIHEFNKKHSNYAVYQGVLNASKYEKYNEFYKVRQELRNQITFYSNYKEICNKFDSVKDQYINVNKENEEKKARLLVEKDEKVTAINKKYDHIIARKTALINELKALNEAKAKEIKTSDKSPSTVNEIEDKYFRQISDLSGQLHGLPEDKAIKAMRKEEIDEVVHACNRDRKYLKTNFTNESYSREEAINFLLIEYKFEHNFAKKAINEVIILDKNKEVRHLTDEEVNERLTKFNDQITKYENDHQDCFVGRPKSFKEQLAALRNENFHFTILSLPVLGIVLFTIVPLIFSILIAFTNYSTGHQPPTQLFTWNGLENFMNLFFAPAGSVNALLPSVLMKTLGWTIVWTVFATFSNYFLGIILALLINKKSIKLKKLWRTIFVMTIAVPQFITLMSIGILLKDTGAVGTWWASTFGGRLGFGTDPTNGALVSKIIILIVNIWIGIPYTMLSTTGILLNIPNDLYESATVDGAGTITQFTKITLPYILFVTGPYLITSFVGNVNNFNVIFFLTGGGPNLAGTALQVGHTDLMITFIYKMVTSANNPQFGIASAIGIVIFVICAFFSIIMYNKSGSIQSEDQFQ